MSQLKGAIVDEIPPYRLQNVVSTFSLGVSGLNLKEIALKYNFLEFNPQTFAAGTLRLVKPRTTALAFASGNMVCTGGKNEIESRYAARKYARIFQKIGIPVCFKDFKIQNIVASAEVGFNLKLQEIADKFGVSPRTKQTCSPVSYYGPSTRNSSSCAFEAGRLSSLGRKTNSRLNKPTRHCIQTSLSILGMWTVRRHPPVRTEIKSKRIGT